MSYNHGPKTITNGLILHLDTANPKSYTGEPTINLVSNAATMASWADYNFGNDGKFITEFGTTGYRMRNRGSWNGVYRGISLNSTGQHTFSALFRYWDASAANNGATVYTSGFGIGDSAVGLNKSLVGRWQRVSMTINASSTSGTFYIISYGGSYGGSEISTWDVTMPQVEKNSHMTQFWDGTRSVTQGFSDLTKNSIVDLTNSVYDSNANLTFNGSSAYSSINNINIAGNMPRSYFAWIKTSGGSFQCILSTGTASQSQTFNLVLYGSAKIGVMGYNNDFYPSSGATITDGIWHLVGATFDGYTLKTYVDGVLDNTANMIYSTIGQNNYIGKSNHAGNEAYFNGTISQILTYNRALVANEVLKLYTNTKSRYR